MIYMIQDDNQKEFSPEESKMDSPFAIFAQCISHIISLITPGNASKLSSTYPAFKSVVDSDSVWEKFLPSDYKKIISISSFSTSSLVTSLSKKKLYFHLCYNPILINNNTMSFALDHESGKKCFMVGARGLSITWGSSPQHWKWLSLPESRFVLFSPDFIFASIYLLFKKKMVEDWVEPKSFFFSIPIFQNLNLGGQLNEIASIFFNH